jgi:3-hydroxyacyl-[acyl-carrier-protein] dehydratase
MNREEIMKILPHRDSMLLLDEAVVDGDTARGKLTIKGDEWFLNGHFPGTPIVPGVIQCEILAQSAGVLLADTVKPGDVPMFTGLDKVRFKNPVRPGDVFETECKITRRKHPFYFGEGTGYVNGALCMKAEFSFALAKVTI